MSSDPSPHVLFICLTAQSLLEQLAPVSIQLFLNLVLVSQGIWCLAVSIHDKQPSVTTQKTTEGTFGEMAALETQTVFDTLASLGVCAGREVSFRSKTEHSSFRVFGMQN